MDLCLFAVRNAEGIVIYDSCTNKKEAKKVRDEFIKETGKPHYVTKDIEHWKTWGKYISV